MIVKTTKHWINPNENPTDVDRKAFELLDKGEVDMFIDYVDHNPVNINVHDLSTVNFLIKAQDVANGTNPVKKLIPK